MQIETRSIDYVPAAERHGRAWHLWPVWFTSGTQLATVATGVIGVALGANLLWSAIAIVTGCALGTSFMALHSAQGPQLGLPQMIQSRPQFGYMGALLVWVIALISYLGYNAFNDVLKKATARDGFSEIVEEKFTVSDKIEEILYTLRDRSEMIFSELFASASSRAEIVVTFLALLELIRLKRLKVRQEQAFGEIRVIKVQ